LLGSKKFIMAIDAHMYKTYVNFSDTGAFYFFVKI